MALKGTLQDFSLADIFQLIGIQRKTGVLTLRRDQEMFTMMFVDGSVVGAESGRRRMEDRLGKVLVKTGRITEAQLQEALRVQQRTLKLLGHVLVEQKIIDSQALRDALQVQITQMIYRLFRWTTGEYDFNQEARVEYDRTLVVPMSAERILMEGARIIDEWPMIEKGIRSFSAVYARAEVEIAPAPSAAGEPPAGPEAPTGAVTLSDAEHQVHRLVDGRISVQEIVERSRLSEFETCRILYELISRQLIEEVQGQVPRDAAQTAAGPARTPSALLLGFAYLLFVLVAGGTVLHRARPFFVRVLGGEKLAATLAPLIGGDEATIVQDAVGEGRAERIDLAIQVYYLLNRGYPAGLRNLVDAGLLRPREILNAAGRSYRYEVDQDRYLLRPPESAR